MVETHGQIKDRLLKSASRIWGLQGTQTEGSFDPLVGILLGACATELEKISHDIEDTRGRTLERFVQLLYPEVLSQAIPAHAIAYAYPSEKTATLQGDAQFFYQKRFAGAGEGASPVWKNIYFSSTGNFTLHQSAVKLVATTRSFNIIKNGDRQPLATNPFQNQYHPLQNSIWLGIENIENLTANTQFYFELRSEAGRNIFYDYLPSAKWYLQGKPLDTERYYGGNISISDKPNPGEIISGKTNTVNRILKHINKFYSARFITVTNSGNQKADAGLPEELKNIYNTPDVKKATEEKLGWIRIDFPENINVGRIEDELFISLNCMPVVNRHLVITQQKLMEHVNIIPLVSEELFLDIAELTDVEGKALNDFNNADNASLISLHFGGVERFNEKNAVATVEGLIQQLRDESTAFSNIGNDFLNTELTSLQQSLNKLEQQITEKQLLKGETPYLIIADKAKIGTSNIYVKYWTTNGEDANNIKAGNTLSLYKNADVQSNSVRFVTNVEGGRNNLSKSDKVLAYKSALLSKEKLVTEEDIATFCRLRLALRDVRVEVTRGFKVQDKANGGFIKTIDVSVFLNRAEKSFLEDKAALNLWQEDLAFAITQHSNFFMPLQVFMKDLNKL
jgi:hypothetical protein